MILKDLKRYIESGLINLYDANEIESITCIIIEEKLGFSRTEIPLNYRTEVENKNINEIEYIIHRLKQNEPIQYILEHTEFYDLNLKLNKSTLIPRQETELFVDNIVSYNKNKSDLKILDIGTGSGCIAISLEKNITNSKIYAIDISNEALSVAKENAELNNANISFSNFDILNKKEEFIDEFDIIVSNPPYVTNKEKELMHKNVLDYEPQNALFVSDDNPLIYYKAIINFAKNNLKKGGQIWLEINEKFGSQTRELLIKDGFNSVKINLDFNNKERFIFGLK